MLAVVGGDREGLLHQPVGLVAIAVRATIRVILSALHAVSVRVLVEATAATLSLHLTVGEEAPRYSTGTPRLAIRPSSHASLSFVPHEDRSGLDRLSLLFR